MYASIWRALPGPLPLRVLLAFVLVLAVIALLFGIVFPWLEPRLPFGDVTVGSAQWGMWAPESS